MFRNPLEERGGRVCNARKWAEMLHHPCILGGPQRNGDKIRIGGAHKWAEMLHHPCILGDPQRKGDKIRIGCLTPAFWEPHKWAEMLHQPCILGDPQQRGQSQSKKKQKKQKQKLSHGVADPTFGPADYRPWGLNQGPPTAEALLYH